jgi:lysophospholipase L1-like esterase
MKNTTCGNSFWIRARQKAADVSLFFARQRSLRGLGPSRSVATSGRKSYILALGICAILLGTCAFGRRSASSPESSEGQATSRRRLAGAAERGGKHWVGTWAASPASPPSNVQRFNNQTLRLVVHTSIGGDQARVHLSNVFGSEPLMVGVVHLALRSSASGIVPGSDRAVTFGGRPSITIPSGAQAVSDAISLNVSQSADLAVSVYFPGTVAAQTVHPMALQTSYVSPEGDFTKAAELPANATTITSWPFLSAISVRAPEKTAAIVALGDSITDGAASKADTNRRWPDRLAQRLLARVGSNQYAVLDEGISGNRLLHDGAPPTGLAFGVSALARFDRDVLAQPGVADVIVLIGINDIGHPGSGAPESEDVSAEDIIAGLGQLIERAHEKGLRIFGCTITPFEGTTFHGYFTAAKEPKRLAINSWIRRSQAFDGVIDFDKATWDPEHPSRLLPAYDSGDHLHPNDAGLKAMGDAIDLGLFR